jgi:hypothetical protein
MLVVCSKAKECTNTICQERMKHEELPWCKWPCTNSGQFSIPGRCYPIDPVVKI